jgi:hypothetical protein
VLQNQKAGKMALDYQSYQQYLVEQNIVMTLRLNALSEEQRANLDLLLLIALNPNTPPNQAYTFQSEALGGEIDTLPQFVTWFLEQNGSTLYDPEFDLRDSVTVVIFFKPK